MPSTPPQITPFNALMPSSFMSRRRAFCVLTWPSASARTMSVVVWLPELPPMPATIGISAASAASFAIDPSNAPTTREATKAVHRFKASHGPRFFALAQTLEKMSSSSRRPTLPSSCASCLSRTYSSTESTVTRPKTRPCGSSTGAQITW